MMIVPCETYQRYLKPGFTPFDPLKLAKQTEEIVCRGDQRKYTKFYCVGVYGGIATGYACGCCLRCIFCWVNWSRDFPEKYGIFRSPAEAFHRLSHAAHKARVDQLRISGAEPTLGKSHLLGVLERVESSPFRLLILETNGILIGTDLDYARQIARFRKIHTRVSLKAGTPEDFTKKTGARPESFDLPFQGIENLIKAAIYDRRNCDFELKSVSGFLSPGVNEETGITTVMPIVVNLFIFILLSNATMILIYAVDREMKHVFYKNNGFLLVFELKIGIENFYKIYIIYLHIR